MWILKETWLLLSERKMSKQIQGVSKKSVISIWIIFASFLDFLFT
jgi:hypothetical protein